MALHLVTAPTNDALSLADAKLHLKVDDAVDDRLIQALIQAASEYCETFTGRKFCTQTWDDKRDGFPCDGGPIVLPFAPTTSVTSVSYVDTAGATQVWTAGATGYLTDLPVGPQAARARVYPAYTISYPSTRDDFNVVTVRFVCGYGTDSDVPASIQAAMKLLIGHWYLHREAAMTSINSVTSEIPIGVNQLLWPYVA